MEVSKLTKQLETIRKGGLARNKDGTISDRLVFIYILLGMEVIAVSYWVFSPMPLPQYAKEIILANVPIIMTLIGCQSWENQTDKKINREREKEKDAVNI